MTGHLLFHAVVCVCVCVCVHVFQIVFILLSLSCTVLCLKSTVNKQINNTLASFPGPTAQRFLHFACMYFSKVQKKNNAGQWNLGTRLQYLFIKS